MIDNVMDEAMKLAKSQLSNFKTIKPSYEKLEAELSAMTQRTEAAEARIKELEARIKESQEQEHSFSIETDRNGFYKLVGKDGSPWQHSAFGAGHKFFSCRPIQPDVAELQRENAELTRKLAEQQALVKRLHGYAPASWLDDCSGAGFEELTKLLAEAKSKAVPKWNRIEDELPEDGQYVIGWEDYRKIGKSYQGAEVFFYRTKYGFVARPYDDDGYGCVTHWMPLIPSSPQPEIDNGSSAEV